MTCTKQDISIKDFVTKAVIKSVEDYKDEMDKFSLEQARKDIAENGVVSWEDACDAIEWEK